MFIIDIFMISSWSCASSWHVHPMFPEASSACKRFCWRQTKLRLWKLNPTTMYPEWVRITLYPDNVQIAMSWMPMTSKIRNQSKWRLRRGLRRTLRRGQLVAVQNQREVKTAETAVDKMTRYSQAFSLGSIFCTKGCVLHACMLHIKTGFRTLISLACTRSVHCLLYPVFPKTVDKNDRHKLYYPNNYFNTETNWSAISVSFSIDFTSTPDSVLEWTA